MQRPVERSEGGEEVGPAERVLYQPTSGYTRALLAAVPEIPTARAV